MTTSPQQELDWRWFFLLFIGLWLAISCFLSVSGGWYALAKKYRSSSSVSGELFTFASVGLGPRFFPVNYGHCVIVRLNSEGIALSLIPLFRFFHPNLFIPWSAISEWRRERFLFMNSTVIYVSEPRTRMLFRGRLGREIYEARSRAA